MKKNSRIYVAGHRGLLGSAIARQLTLKGFERVYGFYHSQFDLTEPEDVRILFKEVKPEYVFLAAARVGGVCSNNSHEADFLRDNLMIQTNVMSAAHTFGVKKLLFMGSACVYPRLAPEPVTEQDLLTGSLEPSNQWYAIAKIAGIKLCQAYRRQHGSKFISCMPTNLYGPGDHYDLKSSHVLPALIRKFHEAAMSKTPVTCWGSGTPTREFLYSDDCADACITLMEKYDHESPVNIGGCPAITICDLANAIAETVGFKRSIMWDRSKPDGTPRRSLDGSMMRLMGWKPKVELRDGLQRTYQDFLFTQLKPHADKIYDSTR